MSNETSVIEVPEGSYSKRSEVALHKPQATTLVQALAAAASNPGTDMDKMERLFAMHQTMLKQEAEAAFNDAMSRAQANILPVANNATNTHTSSRYAKLAAINKAITPLYTAEGLSVSFNTADSPKPNEQRIIAIVSHAGGHSRQYHIDLPRDDAGAQGKVNKTGVQATGSTNSYARRYLVCMIFNVSTEDDNDGNAPSRQQQLPEAQFKDFVKRIHACTTKEKSKAVWREGLAACEKIGDVDSANALKTELKTHADFIDNANKASAK